MINLHVVSSMPYGFNNRCNVSFRRLESAEKRFFRVLGLRRVLAITYAAGIHEMSSKTVMTRRDRYVAVFKRRRETAS